MFFELTGILGFGKYYAKEMGFFCDFNQVLYIGNLQDCLFLISEWFIPKHSLLS